MSSKDEVNKEEIISSLIEVRRTILQKAAAIPAQTQDAVFLGTWSIKDLLAHLAGWDHANLLAVQEILAGQIPSFYEYYDHDWRSYNARLVDKYKRDNINELIQLVEDSHEVLIECLKGLPAEEYQKDRGLRVKGYKIIISHLLQVEIKDENEHLIQIEIFLGETYA